MITMFHIKEAAVTCFLLVFFPLVQESILTLLHDKMLLQSIIYEIAQEYISRRIEHIYLIAHGLKTKYLKRGKKKANAEIVYKLVKPKSHQYHYILDLDDLDYTIHQKLDFHKSSTNHYNFGIVMIHYGFVSGCSYINKVLANSYVYLNWHLRLK